MAAAAAMIKYVEHVQNVLFAQSSLKIVCEALSKVCFIVDPRGYTRASSNRSLYPTLGNCLNGERGSNAAKRPFAAMCRCFGDQCSVRGCGGAAKRSNWELLIRDNALRRLKGTGILTRKLERLCAVVSGAYEIQQLVTLCCYLEKEADSIRSTEQKFPQVPILIIDTCSHLSQ
uniref:Uncharacterized protein n=1 Tax=Parascaris univalens TaxID=6257 RepID=A0A914ZGK5_PARUN